MILPQINKIPSLSWFDSNMNKYENNSNPIFVKCQSKEELCTFQNRKFLSFEDSNYSTIYKSVSFEKKRIHFI